jgi:hypothetical protein
LSSQKTIAQQILRLLEYKVFSYSFNNGSPNRLQDHIKLIILNALISIM